MSKPTIFIAHPSDLLTDHLPNGDGLVAFGFVNELAERGYRLHIATRGQSLSRPLPDNVTLHPLPTRSGNEALGRIEYMFAIRKLLKRLRAVERIDIVHQLNPVFAGLSLGLLGCNLPIVLGTYVARWPDEYDGKAGQSALRKALGTGVRSVIEGLQQLHADALLLTTPAARNRLALPSLVEKKIHLIRHGIDARLFRPAADFPHRLADEQDLSILFYAHVDHRKGVFVLLEAFKKVARAIPNCRMTIVGRGDHMDEFKAKVAASGLADRIQIVGRLDRSEAPALMREHSVYCLPSFGEPYGSTAVEAMSCGMPVVSSNDGGLGHIVPPGGGYKVPPGDPAALAEALCKVLRSATDRVAMGRVNRAHIERHATWERVVDELEKVYRSVVTQPLAIDQDSRAVG